MISQKALEYITQCTPQIYAHHKKTGSTGSQSATPSKSTLLPSMHCAGNFVLEFPSINSSAT